MDSKTIAELEKLAEKITTELDFAEPGKDFGLLPVNCLLGQMEELVSKPDAPQPFAAATTRARGWINDIFDGTGTFSESCLTLLKEWTSWWETALNAAEAPSIPEHWPAKIAAEEKPAAASEPETSDTPVAEVPLILNIAQDGELLGEFINESQEHLQNIEQGVLKLEENPEDAETLASIFRAFHTFKGGSGFLNLTPIQTLAHELESLLDLARQHKLAITPAVINIILEGGDTLKQFTSEIGAQVRGQKMAAPIQIPTASLLARIRPVLKGEAPPAPAKAPTASVPAPGATAGAAAASAKAGATGTSVKVDTLKLDSLVDMVGEMVIAQSLVLQNSDVAGLQNERLTRDLAQLGHISREVQRTVMSLRMVPIRATFQKMNRLVRDISKKLDRPVELLTEGEDTELDRTIVEEISDPLIHMIRNSIDHGIESADVRREHNKPIAGTVNLRAFHQGGNIVIEVKDDGGGLNRDRILAKAIEKGMAKPDQVLTDSEVYEFIMGAGFSTAAKVTDLSGRGVGMDVVRRNVEKLRGKIEIQSTPGKGSTFSIYLPLTLAIIDGLVIGVGEHRYIIPTLLVRESFRPTAGMISTVHGHGEMVNLRGRLRPLLRLYSHLGLQPATTDPTQSIVIVVEVGNDARCVMVDKLLGKQEVVIKSLGETFRASRYLAGAAILGDGRVGLILDPQALVHLESTPLEAAA